MNKFEFVEYLKVVSEKIKSKKPIKKINLDCDLYLELFFGNIIKKLQIIAIKGM